MSIRDRFSRLRADLRNSRAAERERDRDNGIGRVTHGSINCDQFPDYRPPQERERTRKQPKTRQRPGRTR